MRSKVAWGMNGWMFGMEHKLSGTGFALVALHVLVCKAILDGPVRLAAGTGDHDPILRPILTYDTPPCHAWT